MEKIKEKATTNTPAGIMLFAIAELNSNKPNEQKWADLEKLKKVWIALGFNYDSTRLKVGLQETKELLLTSRLAKERKTFNKCWISLTPKGLKTISSLELKKEAKKELSIIIHDILA